MLDERVMEYVAAGDINPEGVRMLLDRRHAALRAFPIRVARRRSWRPRPGCCTPLRHAAPDMEFIAANEAAHCRYMKMITLPKLVAAQLRDDVHEVKVAGRDQPTGHGCRSSGGGDRRARSVEPPVVRVLICPAFPGLRGNRRPRERLPDGPLQWGVRTRCTSHRFRLRYASKRPGLEAVFGTPGFPLPGIRK